MPTETGGPLPEPQGTSDSPEARRDAIFQRRDAARDQANTLRRDVAEVQAAKLESVLYRFMERSGDNPELINAINGLLTELDQQSHFGDSDVLLSRGKIEELVGNLQRARRAIYSRD